MSIYGIIPYTLHELEYLLHIYSPYQSQLWKKFGRGSQGEMGWDLQKLMEFSHQKAASI